MGCCKKKCKKSCKKCLVLPPLSAPFIVTGATGPVSILAFVFPGKRCYKPPTTIKVQISAVSGTGSGTLSLVDTSTGTILATAVVPASAPSTVTLTSSACSSFKCGPMTLAIQGSASGDFSFTIISITNIC